MGLLSSVERLFGDTEAGGNSASFDGRTLTAGIVGAGEIVARNRAAALAQAPGVEVGTVADLREWAAEDIAQQFDAAATDSFEDVLDDSEIDFVYVATPHHLHAEQAIAAAQAGKHVLVEKPLAMELSAADDILTACDDNGVELAVMLPRRCRPEVRKAHELVQSGVIGDPIGFRIEQMSVRKTEQYWESGYSGRIESDWRSSTDRSGGGVLLMNVIHDADELLHVSGLDPSRVHCEYDTFAAPGDVEDFASATIRFRDGGIGSIEASSCVDGVPNRNPPRINKVYGTDGSLVLDDSLWLQTHEPTDYGPANQWHQFEFESDAMEPLTGFVTGFAAAVRGDGEVPASGADGRQSLALLEAAYESGRVGEPVTLPSVSESESE